MSRQSELREEIIGIKRYLSASITSLDSKYDKRAFDKKKSVDIDELDMQIAKMRETWREFDSLYDELDYINELDRAITTDENYIENLEQLIADGHKVESIQREIAELEKTKKELLDRIEKRINEYKNNR